MSLHRFYKSAINSAAALFGARVVGADWGPRGVGELLERVRLRGFSPALVFDIGASNGQWTRACREIFTDASYVLAEPLAHHRDALSTLITEDQRVTLFHGVLGASSGTAQIFAHGDQTSILSSNEYAGELVTVEATTVDALLESQKTASPILLKADVQGYELEVLKGATRCLQLTEMMILEVSFRQVYTGNALAHEIIAYVGERGFRIYEICSYLQHAVDRDLIQSDFVFVHESSSLLGNQGWR